MENIKGIINIELINDQDVEPIYDIMMGLDNSSFILSCKTRILDSYEKLLNDKTTMVKDFTYRLHELVSLEDIQFKEDIKNLNWAYKNINTITNNILTIKLTGNLDDIKTYLRNNPYLKNQKIVIESKLKINNHDYHQIYNFFKEYSNITFLTEENTVPITLNEYKKTLEYLNILINEVNMYNYSPLEKLIYVYDIVKERKYNDVLNNEYHKSRDLTQVCIGHNIVCTGYANILSYVLTSLGIPTTNIRLKSTIGVNGHERNLLYLHDPKYHIKGLYIIDATGDAKHQDHDQKYKRNYYYFLKTPEELLKNNEFSHLKDNFTFMTKENIQEYLKMYDNHIFNREVTNIIIDINRASNLVEGKSALVDYFSETRKYYEHVLNKYYNLTHNPMDYRNFLPALIKVKKDMYYSNPQVYKYDFNSLLYSLFNANYKSLDFLPLICSDSEKQAIIYDWYSKNIKAYKKEILGTRLTRTLKSYQETLTKKN